jgi:hypothetical protein
MFMRRGRNERYLNFVMDACETLCRFLHVFLASLTPFFLYKKIYFRQSASGALNFNGKEIQGLKVSVCFADPIKLASSGPTESDSDESETELLCDLDESNDTVSMASASSSVSTSSKQDVAFDSGSSLPKPSRPPPPQNKPSRPAPPSREPTITTAASARSATEATTKHASLFRLSRQQEESLTEDSSRDEDSTADGNDVQDEIELSPMIDLEIMDMDEVLDHVYDSDDDLDPAASPYAYEQHLDGDIAAHMTMFDPLYDTLPSEAASASPAPANPPPIKAETK